MSYFKGEEIRADLLDSVVRERMFEYLERLTSAAELDATSVSGSVQQQVEELKMMCQEKHVLVAGDTNARRLRRDIDEMVKDDRVEVKGKVGAGAEEVVRKSVEWLKKQKGEKRIFLHAGLEDMLQASTPEEGKNKAADICKQVSKLKEACKEYGGILSVCSVPVVTKDQNQHMATAIKELNNRLKEEEDGYEFIDLQYIQKEPRTMHFDGKQFGARGSLKAGRCISRRIGTFLRKKIQLKFWRPAGAYQLKTQPNQGRAQ